MYTQILPALPSAVKERRKSGKCLFIPESQFPVSGAGRRESPGGQNFILLYATSNIRLVTSSTVVLTRCNGDCQGEMGMETGKFLFRPLKLTVR